ncbi:hypothetical protein [Sorangium sp. So ce542]|uniref:hypothetical protein n=1 Tax=Sorangium sp. So ce542 TaxID=3133316 RepID=UPI003F644AA2
MASRSGGSARCSGGPCDGTIECPAPMSCISGRCCQDRLTACTADTQCCSGRCHLNECQ